MNLNHALKKLQNRSAYQNTLKNLCAFVTLRETFSLLQVAPGPYGHEKVSAMLRAPNKGRHY